MCRCISFCHWNIELYFPDINKIFDGNAGFNAEFPECTRQGGMPADFEISAKCSWFTNQLLAFEAIFRIWIKSFIPNAAMHQCLR